MEREELICQIAEKRSFLCVELNPDMDKIPGCLKKGYIGETLLAFNQAIIESTSSFAVAYKIDKKFYERWGTAGVMAFRATVAWLQNNYSEVLLISDKQDKEGLKVIKYKRVFTRSLDDCRDTIYCVGASDVAEARKIMPKHFLLVTGVNAESMTEVAKQGLMEDGGLLFNFSHDIIHADSTTKFAFMAMQKAHDLQQEMQKLLLSF